jgi:hypothetical protein
MLKQLATALSSDVTSGSNPHLQQITSMLHQVGAGTCYICWQ